MCFFLKTIFYTFIPHMTTICYMMATFKFLFFRIPDFTDKKLEEKIKNNFIDLISKTNITKNIQFRIINHSQFCSAKGINLLYPCVFIPPKLGDIDQNILSFIIKHELSHIKNNDCFFIPLTGLLFNIFLRFLIYPSKSIILNFLPHLIPFLVIVMLSRYQEKKADEYAIKYSNEKELESAIIFFKALQSLNPYSHFSDLLHPSINQRISNIKSILKNNASNINNIEKKNDIIKINKIKNLIIEVILNN